jgi:hypothetical protein
LALPSFDYHFVRGGGAIGAHAKYSEVVWAEFEAEPALGAFCHGREEVLRCLDGGAAYLADEVAVGLGRQVVCGGSMPEMGVDDDAQALELLEIAVDGRRVDVGSEGADRDQEFLGGGVVHPLDQSGEDQPAGGGHPGTAVAELGDEFFDRAAHSLRIALVAAIAWTVQLAPGRCCVLVAF